MPRLVVALGAAVLLIAGASVSARADGDPASDVLSSQTLFLPQDAAVPAGQQAQLAALLSAASDSGYAIRVALIASPADLGSVTALWRQPRSYARFLGQELSLVYRGPLLVVMPDGYGVYGIRGSNPLAGALTPGKPLGTATLSAIAALAAVSGHVLPLGRAGATPGTTGSDAIAWLVFVIGLAVVIAAWAASLRNRPPRLRRATRSP